MRQFKVSDFKVGGAVFVVRAPHGRSKEVLAVTAVGRRWVTLGPNTRFDPETMLLDDGRGGYQFGPSVWRSEADYEAHAALKKEWSRLVSRLVSHQCVAPPGLTHDAVSRVEAILWPEPL